MNIRYAVQVVIAAFAAIFSTSAMASDFAPGDFAVSTPEPASLTLFGASMGALWVVNKARRRKK